MALVSDKRKVTYAASRLAKNSFTWCESQRIYLAIKDPFQYWSNVRCSSQWNYDVVRLLSFVPNCFITHNWLYFWNCYTNVIYTNDYYQLHWNWRIYWKFYRTKIARTFSWQNRTNAAKPLIHEWEKPKSTREAGNSQGLTLAPVWPLHGNSILAFSKILSVICLGQHF